MITLLSATVDEILAVCTAVGARPDRGAAVPPVHPAPHPERALHVVPDPLPAGGSGSAGRADAAGRTVSPATGSAGRETSGLGTAGLDAALRLVDDVDRAAVEAKRRPSDARRTLAGRAALRLLLAARLGIPAQRAGDVAVDRECERCGEQHGRPRVDGLSLSTSSTAGHVLVAVADAAVEVGVDVEVVTDSLFDGFDAFALHPHERRTLPGGEGRVEARIASWVEKEAVLKAAGIGLTTPLEDLLVATAPDWQVLPARADMIGAWEWRPVVQTSSRQVLGLSVTALPSPPGSRCAIAARQPQRIRSVGVETLAGTPTDERSRADHRTAMLASSQSAAVAEAAYRGSQP